MFCSVKTYEGNDGNASSLSLLGHLTYIWMLAQASSYQIHEARFSSQ